MASDQDRAHFRAIAEAEARLNLDSIRECAHRPPGENIVRGLLLGSLAIATGHRPANDPKIPPVWILRGFRPPPDGG